MTAYKLMRVRRDNSIGPLFINRRLRVPVRRWLKAECHPTNGYAVRPGWHCTEKPEAPHLSMTGRAWFRVEIEDTAQAIKRPAKQGGKWYLATKMRVLERIT
jgi:hypothetical protein